MNTTTKPGVLAVIIAAQKKLPLCAELSDLVSARAAVERLAEALSALLDATAINPDFAATGQRKEQSVWMEGNAALAAFRGEA